MGLGPGLLKVALRFLWPASSRFLVGGDFLRFWVVVLCFMFLLVFGGLMEASSLVSSLQYVFSWSLGVRRWGYNFGTSILVGVGNIFSLFKKFINFGFTSVQMALFSFRLLVF